MNRPRIYGSEADFRRALARYIESATAALDEADGFRASLVGDSLAELRFIGWQTPHRWQSTAQRGLSKYLQGQATETLPVLFSGVPEWKRERNVLDELDRRVAWLAAARAELLELQDAVGIRRGIAATPPTAGRFDELLASGLVDRQVVKDHATDMRAPKTPKQLAGAIGAAKELTEATLRGALERIGASWKSENDLGYLMKKWREAMSDKASPTPEGEDALDRAMSGFVTMTRFLAEWRNPYGDGHGHTRYPTGLRARHARVATDTAETVIRFIVTTMDDLQLLPRRPDGTPDTQRKL